MIERNMSADYDQVADVFYVTVGEPDRRARCREEPNGIIWRISPNGQFCGATVRDFRRTWHGRAKELATILSDKLEKSRKEVQDRVLEMA